MKNKLLFAIALIGLVVVGYFALNTNSTNNQVQTSLGNMEHMPQADLELLNEKIEITFNQLHQIDNDWNLKIVQFEPSAKIEGPGTIISDTDEENNPAIKINFYKNGELIHYQIAYKAMPGFHSIKNGQKYLLELIDYSGFKKLHNHYTIDKVTAKIWSIK